MKFGRLRLRHKLSLSLSLAAILPVVVASSVAVRVVLRGLEDGLREQTGRQLRVGMNLVLRHVERLGDDAVVLASTPDLVAAMLLPPQQMQDVANVLAAEEPHLPSGYVQVADAQGRVVATRAVGGHGLRYQNLGLDSDTTMIKRGLAYERRVTLSTHGNVLVVRAVAPIVDRSYELRGAVVLSLPLDGDFADSIKGALGAEVLIHAAQGPAQSSFLDPAGARLTGIAPPDGVALDVLAGGTRQARATINDVEYSLGYAPLKDLDGNRVGMLAVAVGRQALVTAKIGAARSLAVGAAGALVFALALAALLSRRLTRPIARVHQGALAVARGELDVRLPPVAEGDEIGDLAIAFRTMTASLRENQERLAARMREIVALHEAGRAVSSVLGLEEVLRKIVDSIARVLDTRLAALWLVEGTGEKGTLKIGAARASRAVRLTVDGPEGSGAALLAEHLSSVAADVARTRDPLRIADVASDLGGSVARAAEAAEIDGSLLVVPLERKNTVIGVLLVGRVAHAASFTEADENLLATFADQAATAIENARLYEEVRDFSTELEEKVLLRTHELTSMNVELGKALAELRDTQSQLVLSERMAGLGALVAGVAHEINSPSAAIRGSVDALGENVRRLARRARELGEMGMAEEDRNRFLGMVEDLAHRLAERRVVSPAEVRRKAREIAASFVEVGITDGEAAARTLAELGAQEAVPALLPMAGRWPIDFLVGYLQDYAYLYRNAAAIQTAIKQIQRIVGALKSYSHLDQAKVEPADLHEGIENTLVILHHELKYGITIIRRYGQLPRIPVYVDELNQVWTNLIHNAVQALGGKGEIIIETAADVQMGSQRDGVVWVRVIDNGPGIPAEVLPRIFEPFFTTKVKGEGTGLGLGIVKKIVDKHGGRVEVESKPGSTCFTVTLPMARPETSG